MDNINDLINKECKYYVYAYLNNLSPVGEYYYERDGKKYGPFEYEPFYIGQGFGNRIDEHLQPKNLKRNTHKNNKIKKIKLLTGQNPKRIKIVVNITRDKSLELEKLYTKTIGRHDLGFGPLTNKDNGGVGSPGHIAKHRGKQLPLKTRLKISESNRGKILSKETVARYKISNSKRIYKIYPPNGEPIITPFLKDICKDNNLHDGAMYQVALGKQSHYKGWKVEIIQDNLTKIDTYNGYYEYINSEGKIYTSNSNPRFCKELGLNASSMKRIVDKNDKNYLNWKCRKIGIIPLELLTNYYEPKVIIKYKYFLTDPNLNKHETYNLRLFCKEHNLTYTNMVSVCAGKKYYKSCQGWTGYIEKIN